MSIRFDDWRPARFDKDTTSRSTSVVADDPDNPTNWDTCHSITLPAMPSGEYHVALNWNWELNSTITKAMFRAGINAFSGQAVKIEPKDESNISVEHWEDVFTHAGGDIELSFDFLILSDAGSPTLTVDRSLFVLNKIGD